MSLKSMDQQGRWRSKTVAFHISPEENELLHRMVSLSGLTKQDYINARLLNKEVIVEGNPRVYKALRNQLEAVSTQLCRLDSANEVDDDLRTIIRMIAVILTDMRKEDES